MRANRVEDFYGQFPDIDGFWNTTDFQSTESHIRSLLDVRPEESWDLGDMEKLTQLARALNLQKRPDEAATTLRKVQAFLTSAAPSTLKTRVEIRFHLEQGRHLWIVRNPAKAQNHLQMAWQIATENNETFFAIDAAFMLALTQPPKHQDEWLHRALDLAEKTDDENAKLWLAYLYLFEGWRLFDIRRYEEALDYFNKAYERPRKEGETTSVRTIRWSLGRALRSLDRLKEALDIQNSLMTELSQNGQISGHVYLEIAECLQLLQRTEEAKSFYEMAHTELSMNKWYTDNYSAELKRMQFLYKLR